MPFAAAAAVGAAAIGYAASSNAADKQEEIANRQMSQSEQAQAQQNVIQQQQLDLAKRNQDTADDYSNYSKTTFRPLEEGLVSDAANAGNATEQELAAGRAGAAVQHTAAQSREASARNLARMGISANSGRALAVNANLDAQTALGSAAAENTARDTAKQLGWAKRMDAASLGRNLASSQATSAQIANAGLTSAAAGNVGMTNAMTTSNGMLMTNANAQNTSNMQGLGAAAGMAMKYGAGSTSMPSSGTMLTNFKNLFSNTNSGGADGYTLPDGESLPT